MVREQLVLLKQLVSDEWWPDVTLPMLEIVRLRVRGLVQFIETHRRQHVYTDFEDEIGPESEISIGGWVPGTDYARFRDKARAFLRAHLDHIAIRKLRTAVPLTSTDLSELERMLIESGVGTADEIARAGIDSNGLGLFVRSLVGLDRKAAAEALGRFLAGRNHTVHQIAFIELVVDHLTENGVMEHDRLYESPFTAVAPEGPEALFTPTEVDELFAIIDYVRRTALAA